jgi:hypothetical protein
MADQAGPEQPRRRGRGRPFAKGQSGNPKGRTPGQRPPALMLLDQLGEAGAEAVLQKVIAAAEGGDMVAARIVLDRAWPVRKGRAVALDFPEVTTAGGVAAALAVVVQAMGAGQLTPDEASAVSGVIEGQRKAIELADHEQRLAALERAAREKSR